MSTSKEVQKQLDAILKISSNNKCADCKRKNNPRWSSYSLGLVICIQCAGIHRSLGTHITKVKSIDLDFWQPEDVTKLIEMNGNDRANIKYEGKLMNYNSGSELKEYTPRLEELRSYIKTKYDSKKWMITDDEFRGYLAGNKLDLSPASPSIPSESTKAVFAADAVRSSVSSIEKPKNNRSTSSLLNTNTEKLSNLNLKPISKSSTSSLQSLPTPYSSNTNDRTELKKSILALYAKPKAEKESVSSFSNKSNGHANLVSSLDLNSDLKSTSTSSSMSLEENDLFKNVWG